MVQKKAADLYRNPQFVDDYITQLGRLEAPEYYERQALLSLLPEVRGLSILDAGCGPGLYTEWLLAQGARVTAVDESPEMLIRLQRCLTQPVVCLQADLESPLPQLASGAFDGIVCAMVLLHIQDWATVLKNFARLLRPNGWVVASTVHPFADLTPDSNYFAVEEVEEEWEECGIWMPSYRRPIGSMFQAFGASGLVVETWLEPPTPSQEQFIRKHPWVVCFRLRKSGSVVAQA